MIPVKESADDELSWQIVDSKQNSNPPVSTIENHHQHQVDIYKPDPNDDPPGFTGKQIMSDVKMVLKVPPRAKLGCGICKGPEWRPGVFVQFTKENSIARIAGLRPGDQILQCNNFPFSPETPFNEAVSVMRCSGILELVVRKGAGLDLFPGESSGYNSSASSVAGDNPPRLSSISEDNNLHQQTVNDPHQCNGHHASQSERINGEHSVNDNGRSRVYPSGSTVIHVGGDETDNHKIAEIRMVSQQLETKTTTVFVEVHHSEEDNISRSQSEASTDRLTNSSSVSSFTSSASSSLSSAISQEIERRKRSSLENNKNTSQTDKLIKSGLAKEKVQQHEQLMLEFKKAHKKMFSSEGDGNETNQLPSSEEREESRLQNENGCNEAIDKKNKIEERPKHKRQAAPPPPPPFPVGMVVTEEKPAQKKTNTPLQSTKKQPAPPPPPPSPPYCPTPDYDTASLASQMTSDDNNKNGGESDTIKRRGTVAQAQVQKSDIVEMQSLESFKLTDPAKVKPKPPNTYFTQNSSSNQSDTSNGTASTVPIKDNKSKPIVTIREYPAGKERKNPTKFDFLQNISSTQTVDDDKQPIASRLQNELSQTLQRATPTLTKNEIECANKLKNGQVTKNGAGTVVTINISSQSQNCCSKNDLGKQPFYLFPNGKANAIENKKINDLMLQSSVNNNNNNNNNKSYVGNGKARSPLDNSTKNSVTFNFNNKTQETRSVNMVQPNGILKNGNNISHVQIPQQKSIKFGGM
ncbi:hypothetical protein O3M35_006502 [Rhynocoris fuscipes]|uniref:PDZ domain-containing protein n=1 Tax=Rhynocoris fuscipes TaxID=488301 RepID=A0AAW1DLG2_9HEMI